MDILQSTVVACWILFLLYWILSSFFVKPTKEKKWRLYHLRWIVIGIIGILFLVNKFGGIPSFPIPCIIDWSGCHLLLSFPAMHMSMTGKRIGVIIVIVGLGIAFIARWTLAGNWSGEVELKKGHVLVTYGIYRHIRHPIYSGVLLMILGTILFFPTLSMGIFFVVVLGLFIFKLTQEEKLLTKHFPQYKEYKKQTKALVPYLI